MSVSRGYRQLRRLKSPFGNYFINKNNAHATNQHHVMRRFTQLIGTRYCRSINKNNFVCFCQTGPCDVKLISSKICEDINECDRDNGGCQHKCVNTDGSYRCRCDKGYTLDIDQHHCIKGE